MTYCLSSLEYFWHDLNQSALQVGEVFGLASKESDDWNCNHRSIFPCLALLYRSLHVMHHARGQWLLWHHRGHTGPSCCCRKYGTVPTGHRITDAAPVAEV